VLNLNDQNLRSHCSKSDQPLMFIFSLMHGSVTLVPICIISETRDGNGELVIVTQGHPPLYSLFMNDTRPTKHIASFTKPRCSIMMF
jgi:hypothetical protein